MKPEKIPKIAITEAQKVSGANIGYNLQKLYSLIDETKQKDDSTKLAKWLKAYHELCNKEKRLAKIKEELFLLDRLKWGLERQIEHLKLNLG